MTDDDILFDYFTVEERHRRMQEQLEPWEEEGAGKKEESIDLLPNSTLPSRNATTAVTADREDFIKWYEAEVGPWHERV
jgi:hypothetical protein